MKDDYSKRQSAKDAEYEREYQAWVDSMSVDERREAEKLGLLKPCVQRYGNGAASGDSADSPIMRIGDDPALEVPEPEAKPETAMRDATEILRHLVADLLSEGNTRLTVECLAVALGLSAYNGETMTDIAKRHGITRAAVSKRCVDITERLNLPPSRAMRSTRARRIYQKAQLKRKRSS
jgi:hypothetical protein